MSSYPKSTIDDRLDEGEQWATLAHRIINVAREIYLQGYEDRAIMTTQSEGAVMAFVRANPGALSSQIAVATGIQRTNVSTMLRSLEEKGLIERKVQSEDARCVTVHPTPLAYTNYELVRHEWSRMFEEATGDDATSLEDALELLGRLDHGMVRRRLAQSEREADVASSTH